MRVLLGVVFTLAPGLVLVGWVYMHRPRSAVRLTRMAQRDDWQGVRALAPRTARPNGRWVPAAVAAQATILGGIAELVVGHVPAARTAFEHALDDAVPARLRAVAERQLASVDRMAGDLVRARGRLERTAATASGSDSWAVAAQLGLIELAAEDPTAARTILEGGADVLRIQRSTAPNAIRRRALGADLAQCLALVARARRLGGDLDGAAAALLEAAGGVDDRPMIRGQLAVEAARLALARGDRAGAEAHVSVALDRFEGMGAAIDHSLALVARGEIRRDPADLDAAEATLRERGAVGYLYEVAAARRAVTDRGS